MGQATQYYAASIATKPIEGQKTGTSGLRKQTREVCKSPYYVANWVQSVLNAVALTETLEGSTIVVGGDGRFFNDQALDIIVRLLVGHGVGRIIVGKNGLLSTPAVSNLIRKRKALGGFILTASHNPAGIDHDWGIKFNCSSGQPAPDKLTELIYEQTLKVSELKLVVARGSAQQGLNDLQFEKSSLVDFSSLGDHVINLEIGGTSKRSVVEVVDSCKEYIQTLESLFDFSRIAKLLRHKRFLFSGMNAVTGVYASALKQRLVEIDRNDRRSSPKNNVPKESVSPKADLPSSPTLSSTSVESNFRIIDGTPLKDFGGLHPDPNLIHAKHVIEASVEFKADLAAACDGDGDRNMIIGNEGTFINPCDSLAILVDNWALLMKSTVDNQKNTISAQCRGVARSMPTSRAVDAVCTHHKIPIYETPTGWKYFGTLLDAGLVDVCGEESFGTGGNHVREKDGLWAVCCWLSLLAARPQDPAKHILHSHWKKFGRHYFRRADFEALQEPAASAVWNSIRDNCMNHNQQAAEVSRSYEFSYTDPVSKDVASKQGFVFEYRDGSRIVFRKSGTGSVGTTLRIYLETFFPADASCSQEFGGPNEDLLLKKALEVAEIEHHISRTTPDVYT